MNSLLADQGQAIRNLEKKTEMIITDVSRLLPRSYLPPIRKPLQGRDYIRGFNVAVHLRQRIGEMNGSTVVQGYLQFEEDVTDEVINGDAIFCLEGLFNYHTPNLIKTHTWKDACYKQKKACEQVIREAASMTEFSVFNQGGYWWPIRELAKQKFRSNLRNGKRKVVSQNQPSVSGNIASRKHRDTELRLIPGARTRRTTVDAVTKGLSQALPQLCEPFLSDDLVQVPFPKVLRPAPIQIPSSDQEILLRRSIPLSVNPRIPANSRDSEHDSELASASLKVVNEMTAKNTGVEIMRSPEARTSELALTAVEAKSQFLNMITPMSQVQTTPPRSNMKNICPQGRGCRGRVRRRSMSTKTAVRQRTE
ncbi:unnamed protein product [Agarophyton chilense]